MLSEIETQRQFHEVRVEYFGKWDRDSEWKIEFGSHSKEPDATGYCDSKTKTIFLSRQVFGMTHEGLRAFLIHEICHDTGAGHSTKWARRMEAAAKHAESICETEVAKIVRYDIFSYCGREMYEAATGLSASDIYLD